MKIFKKNYILLVFILLLSSVVVYKTYAMFTSTVETDNIVNIDTNMNYTFDINGTQELKVSAKSKLRFNATVKNSMIGTISYGLCYKMINPSSLPSGVIIAQVSDDLTFIAKGQIESNNNKTVPLVIKNNSDSDIVVQIGVRTGYATDSQGVDDIIYNEGEIPITSFQTSEEAGNDSCKATMECTTECIEKIENDLKKEVCYCYTGNDTAFTGGSGEETLSYLNLTARTGTPSFSSVSTIEDGIYKTQDDYGVSYYFRGASTNNFVKFAGYYWRIIRINGDGSIRMIYDGTTIHANGESSSDRQIGRSKFNSSVQDNAYVGYMYGTPGSSTYDKTHANINDSTIKIAVDNWYKTNIVDKGYGDKVADVIYCNDKEVYSGTGIKTTNSYYKGMERINNHAPILTCSYKNDAFTVNDTMKGNGALTYPVGLITADEIVMAGGTFASENQKYYLYTGNYYWTMTPLFYDFKNASVFRLRTSGDLYNDYGGVGSDYGVRPVISLKSDVQIKGNGTLLSPWIVS